MYWTDSPTTALLLSYICMSILYEHLTQCSKYEPQWHNKICDATAMFPQSYIT